MNAKIVIYSKIMLITCLLNFNQYLIFSIFSLFLSPRLITPHTDSFFESFLSRPWLFFLAKGAFPKSPNTELLFLLKSLLSIDLFWFAFEFIISSFTCYDILGCLFPINCIFYWSFPLYERAGFCVSNFLFISWVIFFILYSYLCNDS